MEVGMEKMIYLHVVRMGEPLPKEPQYRSPRYENSTNDWYVLKRGSDGDVVLSRVFEDIQPLNYPNPALQDTTCEVIGSCIYVIGGCSVLSHLYLCHVNDSGSSKIRCLDTRNTRDGWRTCFTLPFNVCGIRSTVVSDQHLYLFGGTRLENRFLPPDPWGCALNVHDDSKEEKQLRQITQPGCSTRSSIVHPLSPNSLVAYIEDEGTMYQLDCSNSSWTVYQKDLPYGPPIFLGGTAVSDDGILYIYDTSCMRLFSYDIRNKKELHAIDLPNSFWFGRLEFVNLIVLAKDNFCIIWDDYGEDVNYIYIYYTRFSVSYLHPKPTVVLEERKSFHIGGFDLINVVAVDLHSDTVTNNLSCSPSVDN